MVTEKLLTSVVLISPSEYELQRINDVLPQITDWDKTFSLLTQHGSAPLLFSKLPKLSNQHLIPSSIRLQLQQVYYKTLTRNMLLYNAFSEVLKKLNDANIQVVALKGIYLSAALYSDIALRQLSDIDILVPIDKGEETVNILRDMGYESRDPSVSAFISTQTEIVHFPPLVRNGISIEVHIRLHRKNANYAIDTPYMLQNTTTWEYQNQKIHALDLNNLLVHLCVHIDKHFAGGHIQMKCFNDIVNILHLQKTKINWNQLIETTRIHSSEHVVFKYLILIAYYYNQELPIEIQSTYSHLLSEELKKQFTSYLHCNYEYKYHYGTHVQNIRQIRSKWNKLRYLIELIFPSKKFMIQKYNLNRLPDNNSNQILGNINNQLRSHGWWMWYPYRWLIGLKGFFKYDKKAIR